MRDRGLASEPQLAAEQGAPEDEILAAEDELVLRSARWAQQALGRSSPELSDLLEGSSGSAWDARSAPGRHKASESSQDGPQRSE